jgi:hypothetical protein
MNLRSALVILVMLYSTSASAQSFADAMKQVFSQQYRGYQWLDYPLNDFGVGTAYENSRERTDPKTFLCATFTCLGIAPTPIDKPACYSPAGATDPSNCPWATVARSGTAYYANVGCGTQADAQLSLKRSLALKALLPLMLRALGLSAIVDDSVTSSVTVTVSSACDRRLLPGPYNNYIARLASDDYGLKNAQAHQRLVLIRNDIVITGFDVTVKKESKLGIQLEAKLQGAQGNTTEPSGSAPRAIANAGQGRQPTPAGQAQPTNSPGVSVQYSRDPSGQYHLRTSSPLIVGIAAVKQPPTAGISPSVLETWDGWTVTNVPLPKPR